MKDAHTWAVELCRAITGKDQRDREQHDTLMQTVESVRQEQRNEDIAVIERQKRRFIEQSAEAKASGNRTLWGYFEHAAQASDILIKAIRTAKTE